ncbi:MAG: hypothetical protein Fur0042_03260 [Cyanophyceae cyanobacterium]
MDGLVAVSPTAAPWIRPYRAVEWVSGPREPEPVAIARSRTGLELLEAGVNSCVVLAEVTAIVAGSWAAQSLLMPTMELGDRGPSVAELEASFLTPEAIENLELGEELNEAIAAEWAQHRETPPRPQPQSRPQPPRSPQIPLPEPLDNALAAPEWIPQP